MPLHQLGSLTIGVPNIEEVAHYYQDFGLAPTDGGGLATVEGGEQLRLIPARHRGLEALTVGVDDEDDIGRIAARLSRLGDIKFGSDAESVTAVEPVAGFKVTVHIMPRMRQLPASTHIENAPGRIDRPNSRAAAILRLGPVKPRRLGHVVLGSVDHAATQRFFVDGLGFKVSDWVPSRAAFLRCSTDHHNVLVQQAPINFFHHSSWQVDDIDEIGRGATTMLAKDPGRHVWGLGRHHIGSNYFWYLKDPAGNFSEYYSDLDCVVDDALWEPREWEGIHTVYNWGPPVPPSFLKPDDLAALMTGAHSTR